MTLSDLSTPCLLVERSHLERNLRRMQERADAQGVALRPHTKTHKSIALARRQAALGARGLTVAKGGEAEVFVAAGFEDVRLAYAVVGHDKHARLLQLMDRARISFCVDTAEGARAASNFYESHGRRAEVLVEVDVGHGRCGVPAGDPASVAFAAFVAGLPGLRLAGLLTHEGQAYHGPKDGEDAAQALRRVAAETRDALLHLAAALSEAGTAAPGDFEISLGSTPSMTHFENGTHAGFTVTEIRPGNYVFYDAMQVNLGSCALADCALTALATVISRRPADGITRLYLDAGKKVLTSDTGYRTDGYGILLADAATLRPFPGARITGLSEEHAWVEIAGDEAPEVGARLRIVPNHACTAVNTQETLYLVDGNDVVETLPVDARGRVA